MQRLFSFLAALIVTRAHRDNLDDFCPPEVPLIVISPHTPEHIQPIAPHLNSKSRSKNVNHLRGGGSDIFPSIFIITGFTATIVGLIVILVGAAGPKFGVLTAGIILIGIGVASTIFGIVSCLP